MSQYSRSRLLPALFLLSGVSAWSAGPIFNVLDYGARNDGSAPATEAIRSAIQAAHTAGGGTVYFPGGNYVTGPIALVSNLVLHIDAGATLRFPAARLPYTWGRIQGIECLTAVPLIGGRDLENVSITGRGVITTDNAEWTKLMGGPEPRTATYGGSAFGPEWNRLRELLELKTPQPDEVYQKVAPFIRPAFIRVMESKNILVEGIHIVGAPNWTIHILYSQDVVIRDVGVATDPGAFTGAIYIDSSRNVRISNCDLDSGDDAITLKAGKDADGRRVNRMTENVSITNCVVHHGSSAVALGSETSGSIRNVVASNIICQGTRMGIDIKSQRGRGGVVEDILFDNWTMDDIGRAINVSQYYQMQGEVPPPPEPLSSRTPMFRNIVISNMVINHSQNGTLAVRRPVTPGATPSPQMATINIAGLEEAPITGLRISNVVASGMGGLKAYNTVGLELHNVQMNADVGPAFQVRDSSDLDLDGVSTRKPLPGMPVVRLDRCPGAVVRGSKAVAGTGTFLSVPAGELKSVALEGNALGSARQATEESATDFWQAPPPPAAKKK
jgi:polygalacturonase